MMRALSLVGLALLLALAGSPAFAQRPDAPAARQPEIAWRAGQQDPKISLSSPLIADGMLVVGDSSGALRAYRDHDGLEMWTLQHGKSIVSAPVSDNTSVYFSSDDGVTAVAVQGGLVMWNRPLAAAAGGVANVFVAKSSVFAGGYDGFVYALDPKNGDIRWKASLVENIPPDPPGFAGNRARFGDIVARPGKAACDDDTFYQPVFDQSRVVALEIATGKLRWSYQAGGWIDSAPAVTARHLLVGSQDKSLHCLDKRTGELVWKFQAQGRVSAGIAVDDEFVYFGACDGNLYCLRQADGREVWRYATEPDYTGRRFINATPVIAAGVLYCPTCEGQVYALDQKNGDLRWKFRAAETSQIVTSPILSGPRLFVVTRPDWEDRGESSLIAIRRP